MYSSLSQWSLALVAVIQLIMLIKQRADIKRWYLLFCEEFDANVLLNERLWSYFT